MGRSLRASAAAAAKKILAQSTDDGNTGADVKARPRRGKRKRSNESPVSDDEDAFEADGDENASESDLSDLSDAAVISESEDDAPVKKRRVGRVGRGSRQARKPVVQKEAGPRLSATETAQRLARLLEGGKPANAAPPKKKGSTKPKTNALAERLFSRKSDTRDRAARPACCPPERRHDVEYHRPLLLDGARGRRGRRALLAWYDATSAARGMPWRRAEWLDPRTAERSALARRAYEVWISEIMAQQTRIAVVIGYWARWTARWPTMADLAVADAGAVMHEWAGLGYYSRAARLHEAARVVVADPDLQGLLPADVATLEARVPGVGRYTAGAISAIVFGRAAAMVDGNVIRVLSRQLGLYGDSKAEKRLVDLLWAAAQALVQAVARDGDLDDVDEMDDLDEMDEMDPPISDRPGRWGQALMELGSTVCAPKPDCAACPITETCRAYAEGLRLHEQTTGGALADEPVNTMDACELCEQFPEMDDEEATALAKDKAAKMTKAEVTSPFFDIEDAHKGLSTAALAAAVGHARAFPLRRPKKPVRCVDTLVCAVRVQPASGSAPVYLLHQRPATGLLARLWQLPSHDLPGSKTGLGAAEQQSEAAAFVDQWLAKDTAGATAAVVTKKVHALASIPWLFSHLRQTMHVFLFEVEAGTSGTLPTPPSCVWATVADAEATLSMGTGMRKCWDLVTCTA